MKKPVVDVSELEVDESCKNQQRLCFVSDDPQLYLNSEAVSLEAAIAEKAGPGSETSKFNLRARTEIAKRILGAIQWTSQTEGFCQCPGIVLHASSNDALDCRVRLDGTPTVVCFHGSCQSLIERANRYLRSEVGKNENNLRTSDASEGDAELSLTYGAPVFFKTVGSGIASVNERFFAARFHKGGCVLFERGERSFYRYSQHTGLWRKASDDQIREELSAQILEYGRHHELAIESKVTTAITRGVLQALRGISEKENAFKRGANSVHVANGIIRFGADGHITRTEFRPTDYSRNCCPIGYHANVGCPRFLKDFLAQVLLQEDIDLLQRFAGLAVAGVNPAQRIVILDGAAGAGKSTMAKIIHHIVGTENCIQLRTELLSQRFETFRFAGKTLLLAPDTPGDFLNKSGASVLKSLVGGDLLSGEAKGSNADFSMEGNFNVLITSNSRLRVRLDGDADAWRRRLMIVRFDRVSAGRRIPNFADQLLAEESPGILQWCLEGLRLARDEISKTGDLRLTETQKDRVDSLLSESDSIRRFVQECTVRSDGDASTQELVEAYFRFCSGCRWTPTSSREVELSLPDLLLEIRGASKNHCIKRSGGSVRGWRGISLRVAQAKIAETCRIS